MDHRKVVGKCRSLLFCCPRLIGRKVIDRVPLRKCIGKTSCVCVGRGGSSVGSFCINVRKKSGDTDRKRLSTNSFCIRTGKRYVFVNDLNAAGPCPTSCFSRATPCCRDGSAAATDSPNEFCCCEIHARKGDYLIIGPSTHPRRGPGKVTHLVGRGSKGGDNFCVLSVDSVCGHSVGGCVQKVGLGEMARAVAVRSRFAPGGGNSAMC